MKKDFRCELTVHDPKEFLEQCGIRKDTIDPAELKRVIWVWDKRPEKKPYTKWAVYAGIVALTTISGQAHSTWLTLGSAIVSILALEVLDRVRRKRLNRWSLDYRNGIRRLLSAGSRK
jgi:hypothetical protein